MSNWVEIHKDNIEVEGDEIEIFLFNDENGNNYGTIKVKDMEEKLKQ